MASVQRRPKLSLAVACGQPPPFSVLENGDCFAQGISFKGLYGSYLLRERLVFSRREAWRLGNWEISPAPEEKVYPLMLCGDKSGGTTYPELPAKDGDFAFDLFLS